VRPDGQRADDLVGARGRAHVAHLAGHLQALEHARRGGGADGAGLANVHRAVRVRAAANLVPLDEALQALACRGLGDVDELAGGEDLGLELLARLETFIAADLDDVAGRLDVGLLELAVGGLGELLLVRRLERDAGGGVPVLLGGAQAEDPAGAGLEHGHRRGGAGGLTELGHPNLPCQQALHRQLLISMLTPAGRLRRWRASTTRGLKSRMSTTRLWVRISNCSRESLSMKGERMTVSLAISVGSGIGPAVRALARRAV